MTTADPHGICTAHEFTKGSDDRFYQPWTKTQQGLAEQRRTDRPGLETWGPFDQAEPDPDPAAVADVDRDLWVRDAASRRWHLRYTASEETYTRVQPMPWAELVLQHAPVTLAPPEFLELLPVPTKKRKPKALPPIDPVLKLRLPKAGVAIVDAQFRRWLPTRQGRYAQPWSEETVTPEALAAEAGPLRALESLSLTTHAP